MATMVGLNKTVLLSKYRAEAAPEGMNAVEVAKLGIFSAASIDPISIKLPNCSPDMLFIFKPKGSPAQGRGFAERRSPEKKSEPAVVLRKDADEEVKRVEPERKEQQAAALPKKAEVHIVNKMPVFTLLAAHFGIDPLLPTWSYKKGGAEEGRGPLDSETMDRVWMESANSLPLDSTSVLCNDIMFRKDNKEFTLKEEGIVLGSLLSHSIFTRSRKRVPLAPSPAAIPAKPEKKAESVPAPKPEAAPVASKPEAEEERIVAPSRTLKEDAGDEEEFDVVYSTNKKKNKKKLHEQKQKEEKQKAKAGKKAGKKESDIVIVSPPPAKPESSESDPEEGNDFEYIPTKTQVKKQQKKKISSGKEAKQGKVGERVVEASPKEGKAQEAKREEAKVQAKKEEAKVRAKKEEAKMQAKKEETQSKVAKKKGKKQKVSADQAILGTYLEKPKPKKEPDTWGDVPQTEKVSLEKIMEDERKKTGSKQSPFSYSHRIT